MYLSAILDEMVITIIVEVSSMELSYLNIFSDNCYIQLLITLDTQDFSLNKIDVWDIEFSIFRYFDISVFRWRFEILKK